MSTKPLRLRKLGLVPYGEARDLQQALFKSGEDYVLVLEHPTTITLGRRADTSHIVTDPSLIGAEVIQTDRGGDVTLHAPGQLVAYAIVSIDDDPHAISGHVRNLEDAVIATVEACVDSQLVGGVGRLEGCPGVWVGIATSNPAKIAAVGVRTEKVDGKRRTLHGIALNVTNDLSLFSAIVPCGITGRGVTSLFELGSSVAFETVEATLASRLAQTLFPERDVEEASVRKVNREKPDQHETTSMSTRRLIAAGIDLDETVSFSTRKPEWLRVKARRDDTFLSTNSVVSDLGLVTVCEEAGCPNIFECWADGTATFMVNGERCTRACSFCLVDTQKPFPLDASEPDRVAQGVERMGLAHAVVTCVARDDLADGGAGAIGETIHAIRRRRPQTSVEVLISDCKGDTESLSKIFDARTDVLNHNIETVARLQKAVRPSAGYARSLTVLARASSAGLVTKSGIMVGLGERDDEIITTLQDLASVGVQLVTIGQYLRPTKDHAPVDRYADPSVFEELAEAGRRLGLRHVQASPLTRSSYHAREASEQARVPVRLRQETT